MHVFSLLNAYTMRVESYAYVFSLMISTIMREKSMHVFLVLAVYIIVFLYLAEGEKLACSFSLSLPPSYTNS